MTQRAVHDESLSLAARLRARIRASGPMSFRDWMEAALYDQRDGYYQREDLTRWGRSGDYRTGPERSPLFAATFARYFAGFHKRLGSPESFTIYEAGAGAGHFALDVLNALRREHAHMYAATQYVIDEKSSASRRQIAARLEQHDHHVSFVTGEFAIKRGVVFANELLDALPVHRVRITGGVLRELFVGVNETDEFFWCEREPGNPRLAQTLARTGAVLREGQTAEINLAAEDWLKQTAVMLVDGLVIIVDYGAEAAELYDPHRRFNGTLRAIRRHEIVDDLLADPGEQDLTAHVSWTQLIDSGGRAGLRTIQFQRQDQFLLNAGLLDQLELFTKDARAEDAAALRLQARELIMPDRMSADFQILIQEK